MKEVRFVLEPEIIGEQRNFRTGMWAATKRDSDPTARQSLEAIARRMETTVSNKHTPTSGRSKLSLSKCLKGLRIKPNVDQLKNWIWSFTLAGRAARTEREWEEAVKRAYATQAAYDQMHDLTSARERHDEATRSFVSSAAGHRHRMRPAVATQAEQTMPTGPAGSMWSNEPVVPLSSSQQNLASQVITPGLRRFTPTPRHPAAIVQREATYVESADELDHESGTASPELQKSSSIDAVDALMKGDADGMVCFGRWRHHKDAPMSLVRGMIERDLRESGPCSIYGPGGLTILDHPLVSYYNDRLQKIQQDENYNASSTPPFSPVTMEGRSLLQRPVLRALTPVTFSMDQNGMFKSTGFHTRTASMSSTIESSSPAYAAGNSDSEQEDARHDSGTEEILTVHHCEYKRVFNRYPSNYQVMRPYTPDSGLNIMGLNNGTVLKYHKNLVGFTTLKYQQDHCGGAPGLVGAGSPDPNIQLLTAHVETPQLDVPDKVEYRQPGQQRILPQQHGYTMQRTGHYVPPTNYTQPDPCVQAEPQVQHGHEAAPPKQDETHIQQITGKQGTCVGFRLPGPTDRQITYVSADDDDDAMWSDEESDDEGTPEPQYSRRKVMLPSLYSRISKMIAEITSQITATVSPQVTEAKAGANRSAHSSFDSTTANAAVGLNTSTEPTPSHITPATTASSGGHVIKSPGHAESMGRKLADHLRKALSDEDETSQISF